MKQLNKDFKSINCVHSLIITSSIVFNDATMNKNRIKITA